MRQLKLYFEGGQLMESQFIDGVTGVVRQSVRGKSGGAYRTAGSFQWTSAVKGLAVLFLTASEGTLEPLIKGGSGSLTASLDYAISKQPSWISEMFGCDRDGLCFIRRMILRTNPERKRPGPTVLSLNEKYLPRHAISIFCDGRLCVGEELRVLLFLLSTDAASDEVAMALPRAA